MVGKNQIHFYQNLNTNQRSTEFKLSEIGNSLLVKDKIFFLLFILQTMK
jgi:hypothetical protein